MIGPITGMIWYGVPFFGIMILAALQSMPKDVNESALLDGAGRVSVFLKITIPYIRPVIIITLLLRVIWVFNSPDILYAMTSGGPAYSSSTLPLYVFNKAFASLDFGYGAATGILIMLFLVLYAVFFLAFTRYDRADDF
jgi:multiple sugar transport system permease protein